MTQQIEYKKVDEILNGTQKQNIFWVVSLASMDKLEKLYPGSKQTLINRKCCYFGKPNYNALDEYRINPEVTAVYGLGGGTTIDVAKYLAKKHNLPCCAIPSMLSTNVFATNKVATIRDGKKATEDGVLPEVVYIDSWLLDESPEENSLGLVDALSISTALQDWIIASGHGGELVDTKFYNWACDILFEVIHAPADGLSLCQTVDILAQAGYITNEYGSGRPESGSEHIFAKNLEEHISIHHSLAVALGILCMRMLQYRTRRMLSDHFQDQTKLVSRDTLTHCFRSLGVFDALIRFYFKHPELDEILEDVLDTLTPRPDRYTVLDTADMSRTMRKELLCNLRRSIFSGEVLV